MAAKKLTFDEFGFTKMKFDELPYGPEFVTAEGYGAIKARGHNCPDYASVPNSLCTFEIKADELVFVHRSDVGE